MRIAPGSSVSSELSQATIDPFAWRNPLLIASDCPASASETNVSRPAYSEAIRAVSSVDPPSRMMYSTRG